MLITGSNELYFSQFSKLQYGLAFTKLNGQTIVEIKWALHILGTFYLIKAKLQSTVQSLPIENNINRPIKIIISKCKKII